MSFLSTIRQRLSPNLKSLNEMQISRNAIIHNYGLLKSLHPNQHLLPVLKSNAYGHGTQQIATILRETDTPLICVDSYPEAQIVRNYARKDVLIMSETHPENYRHFDHRRLHVTVRSEQVLDALIQTGKPRKIHLFVDTGMHREGLELSTIESYLAKLRGSKCTLVGVMSHFADADEDDNTFDTIQISQFGQAVRIIRDAGYDPMYIHHTNTAGRVRHDDAIFTVGRVGLGLYGRSPLSVHHTLGTIYQSLQPAMRIISTITAIQHVRQGEGVSYGRRWRAEYDTRVAVIPFGYHEGLRRSLRGSWSVRWGDQWFPVIGTICMNLCCIQIGDSDVQLGDRVEVIGNGRGEVNSLDTYAQIDETIVYEVLVNMDEKIRRIIL